MNVEKLKRQLIRLKDRENSYTKLHNGVEYKFTYWAGFELGYVKGRIREIDEYLDEIENDINQ